MKKAIATKPGEATEHVDLSAEEQTQRTQEESAFFASRPLDVWKASMARTDAGLPRYAEDIIDALDAPARARIAPETLDKYNAKKALRLEKPALSTREG